MGTSVIDGYLFQPCEDGSVAVFYAGERIAVIPDTDIDTLFALDDEDIDDLVFAHAVRKK